MPKLDYDPSQYNSYRSPDTLIKGYKANEIAFIKQWGNPANLKCGTPELATEVREYCIGFEQAAGIEVATINSNNCLYFVQGDSKNYRGGLFDSPTTTRISRELLSIAYILKPSGKTHLLYYSYGSGTDKPCPWQTWLQKYLEEVNEAKITRDIQIRQVVRR